MAYRSGRLPGRLHGSTRYEYRQRGAAVHGWRIGRQRRRRELGAHFLFGLERGGPSHQRMAIGTVRA